MSRQLISSGTEWETKIGYSRAVRVGNQVFVSGTTASGPNGTVGVGDAAAQTKYILEKITAALADAGAKPEHVVKSRIYTTDISQWEVIGAAHGDVFKDIRPALVLVEVSKLISDDHLVEIEVDAIITD